MLLFLVAHIELGVAVVRDRIRNGAALDSPYVDRETFLIDGKCLKERQLLGHFDDGVSAFYVVISRMCSDAAHRDVAVKAALTAYGHAVIETSAFHIEATQRALRFVFQDLVCDAAIMARLFISDQDGFDRTITIAEVLQCDQKVEDLCYPAFHIQYAGTSGKAVFDMEGILRIAAGRKYGVAMP